MTKFPLFKIGRADTLREPATQHHIAVEDMRINLTQSGK